MIHQKHLGLSTSGSPIMRNGWLLSSTSTFMFSKISTPSWITRWWLAAVSMVGLPFAANWGWWNQSTPFLLYQLRMCWTFIMYDFLKSEKILTLCLLDARQSCHQNPYCIHNNAKWQRPHCHCPRTLRFIRDLLRMYVAIFYGISPTCLDIFLLELCW